MMTKEIHKIQRLQVENEHLHADKKYVNDLHIEAQNKIKSLELENKMLLDSIKNSVTPWYKKLWEVFN